MGGEYWRTYFPPTVRALLDNQSPDGSWPAEEHHYDAQFGNAYTTALVVPTLGTPNRLLPIFQRQSIPTRCPTDQRIQPRQLRRG
jgi:hypothetical protein